MNQMVSADGLAEAVRVTLEMYAEGITERQKKAVDQVGREVNKEIKKRIPFKSRSGKYLKAFRVITTYEDAFSKIKKWHVEDPEYRLTHLLENGHDVKCGGKKIGEAGAFPHIKYGEELAKQRMLELSEEAIRDAGR